LLHKVAENEKLSISFEPKILKDWNGSGCHTNFSTKTMRSGTGGMDYINVMMERLNDKHTLHMQLYGEDNNKRMTGIHETADYNKFTFGVGNRGASVRIPTQVSKDKGKGYIEDRRPASNIDPYVVSSLIFDTTCLQESQAKPMIEHYKKWTHPEKMTKKI